MNGRSFGCHVCLLLSVLMNLKVLSLITNFFQILFFHPHCKKLNGDALISVVIVLLTSLLILSAWFDMVITANRAVEVNEMWRLRQKELEVENRIKRRSENECRNKQILDNENRNKHRSENEKSSRRSHKDVMESRIKAKRHNDVGSTSTASCSSKKRDIEDYYSREDGLRDEEVEKFLHSRSVYPISSVPILVAFVISFCVSFLYPLFLW